MVNNGRAPNLNQINKKCRLCTKEKYYIISKPEDATQPHLTTGPIHSVHADTGQNSYYQTFKNFL